MIFNTVISGGGGEKTTLTVTTTAGATVTVTDGKKTYTGVGPAAVFEGLTSGVWTATATLEGITKTSTIEIGAETIELHTHHVYGISRNIAATSPKWTRTDDAVGFTATASVGTVAGQSDFDDCYPWSDIKREKLSSGDTMVKIPKFYFRRYREGNVEYIKIADKQLSGFTLHPAFNHGGVESSYVYVGAYKTSTSSSVYKSVTGVVPCSLNRYGFRNGARNKGTGWGLFDISTLSAIQMLILVEFATNDVQTAIGKGICSSGKKNTGTCDSVPNLTGSPSGTSGATDVVWRGIEGLWGNVWEYIDGLNYNAGTYYVCNNRSKYADDTASNYEQLSYSAATNWSQSYITSVGLDSGNNSHVMLPSAAGSGSASTYMCDACWTSTGWKNPMIGADGGSGDVVGLFATDFTTTSSSSNYGSRLLYIPA